LVALVQADSRFMPLRDNSIDCVVSSPPIWKLRDYESSFQIGQESLLAEYLDGMRSLYAEIFRVLKRDGLFGLNLGNDRCWTKTETPLVPSMLEDIAKGVGFLVVRLADCFWLLYPERDKRPVSGPCLSFTQQAKSCILAASEPGGFVLDPCAGKGTVARIAHECGRHGVAIDTNRELFEPMEVGHA
jgi:DNA modification methylase